MFSCILPQRRKGRGKGSRERKGEGSGKGTVGEQRRRQGVRGIKNIKGQIDNYTVMSPLYIHPQ